MFALFVLNGIKGNLEEWRTRFGFLYSSFEPECWYWEVVEVSKKGICSNLLSIGFSNGLLLTLLKICLHTHSHFCDYCCLPPAHRNRSTSQYRDLGDRDLPGVAASNPPLRERQARLACSGFTAHPIPYSLPRDVLFLCWNLGRGEGHSHVSHLRCQHFLLCLCCAHDLRVVERSSASIGRQCF